MPASATLTGIDQQRAAGAPPGPARAERRLDPAVGRPAEDEDQDQREHRDRDGAEALRARGCCAAARSPASATGRASRTSRRRAPSGGRRAARGRRRSSAAPSPGRRSGRRCRAPAAARPCPGTASSRSRTSDGATRSRRARRRQRAAATAAGSRSAAGQQRTGGADAQLPGPGEGREVRRHRRLVGRPRPTRPARPPRSPAISRPPCDGSRRPERPPRRAIQHQQADDQQAARRGRTAPPPRATSSAAAARAAVPGRSSRCRPCAIRMLAAKNVAHTASVSDRLGPQQRQGQQRGDDGDDRDHGRGRQDPPGPSSVEARQRDPAAASPRAPAAR